MSAPETTMKSGAEAPMAFGSADLRLSGRQWLCVLALLVPILLLTPAVWKRIERFDTGPNYRLPYDLSRDYWLYQRRLDHEIAPTNILMIGDSVIWGEYVRPDGTWSSFMNREAQGSTPRHYVNAGVNGLFPLALEGLVRNYAPMPRGQKVIVNCNLLWMTSPQADLSSEKQEHFNHSRLVPQFSPRIPCYRADASERLGAIIQNHVPFLAWVNHLQDAYYEQKSVPGWTLADDGGDPAKYPNAWRNPFAQLKLAVPTAPENDPQRGPESPRHHAWSNKPRGTSKFEWVSLDASLQWAAFQRLIALLHSRGNDVFVMVGPFNEHMLAEENVPDCRKTRDGIDAWLTEHKVPHLTPEPLPSELYADASHPLTAGYELLAKRIAAEEVFKKWVGDK
jgi:hypothetical protein